MKRAVDINSIVVDLDRTLLHTDKTLSSFTLKVLKQCKNNGMRIMVATARPLRAAMQYCEMIQPDAIAVSNGARVILGDRQIDCEIRKETAARLLYALQQYPALRITLETGGCAYSNKPVADYETILTDDLVGTAQMVGVLKILVHLDSQDTLSLVCDKLPDDLYYSIANGYLMQIMNKSATKWNGIKEMLALCGGSPEKTAYFGDDYDDIEPIKMCGMGIAVANGIPEVRAAADYIAENNDADGVAKFIAQKLL